MKALHYIYLSISTYMYKGKSELKQMTGTSWFCLRMGNGKYSEQYSPFCMVLFGSKNFTGM